METVSSTEDWNWDLLHASPGLFSTYQAIELTSRKVIHPTLLYHTYLSMNITDYMIYDAVFIGHSIEKI